MAECEGSACRDADPAIGQRTPQVWGPSRCRTAGSGAAGQMDSELEFPKSRITHRSSGAPQKNETEMIAG